MQEQASGTDNQFSGSFVKSPEFQQFIRAFGEAVQDEQLARSNQDAASDNSYTEVPSDK